MRPEDFPDPIGEALKSIVPIDARHAERLEKFRQAAEETRKNLTREISKAKKDIEKLLGESNPQERQCLTSELAKLDAIGSLVARLPEQTDQILRITELTKAPKNNS